MAKQKAESDRLAALEEKARASAAEKIKARTIRETIPLPHNTQGFNAQGGITPNNTGNSALQRATSAFTFGASTPQDSAKMRVLGFRASEAQMREFDEKYKYNIDQLSPIPPEIGNLRLLPVAKLQGDSLVIFANPQERQKVEEYLMYHPYYAKVFSNYTKRIMTLNGGQTGSLSVKDALINELSYKVSTIEMPSVLNINQATDTYLYITSRLNEADQVKFWNWVNLVRTGSVVDVPEWVRLVDVIYSSN